MSRNRAVHGAQMAARHLLAGAGHAARDAVADRRRRKRDFAPPLPAAASSFPRSSLVNGIAYQDSQ